MDQLCRGCRCALGMGVGGCGKFGSVAVVQRARRLTSAPRTSQGPYSFSGCDMWKEQYNAIGTGSDTDQLFFRRTPLAWRNVQLMNNRTADRERCMGNKEASCSSRGVRGAPLFNGRHVLKPVCCFQTRFASSFIRQVKDQLKAELDSNENLRKAVEEFQKLQTDSSTDPLAKLRRSKETVIDFYNTCSAAATSTFNTFSSNMSNCTAAIAGFSARWQILALALGTSSAAAKYIGLMLAKTIDGSAQLLGGILEENEISSAKNRMELWRSEMKRKRHAGNLGGGQPAEFVGDQPDCSSPLRSSSARHGLSDGQSLGERVAEDQFALVLSHDSSWDRFGSRLREMPFLNSFFANPMVQRIFGETEQAAAIREVKAADSSFKLSTLMETVEYIVAPHIVTSYLNADDHSIRLHCGEAAYGTLSQSIKERKYFQYTMDPTLILLRNVELRGAKRSDTENGPWFIFSFSTQQINCMRDKNGEVVVGAVDDVREVLYVMALTPHPKPETDELQYPWMIKEFAILGSTPCW